MARLEQDLDAVIDRVSDRLSELEVAYLRRRWRDEVVQAREREHANKKQALAVRVTIAVMAVLVPAFIGQSGPWPQGLAFVLSIAVAAGTAIEGVFRFGARWRMNRVLFQELLSEGWSYAQVVAPYAGVPEPKRFAKLVARTELLLGQYADEYLQEITLQRPGGTGSTGPIGRQL